MRRLKKNIIQKQLVAVGKTTAGGGVSTGSFIRKQPMGYMFTNSFYFLICYFSSRTGDNTRHFFTASACTDSYLWASTSDGSLLTYSLCDLTLQANVMLYSSLTVLAPFDNCSLLSFGVLRDEAVEAGTSDSEALLVWKLVTSN